MHHARKIALFRRTALRDRGDFAHPVGLGTITVRENRLE
jgi:hypothetical protein